MLNKLRKHKKINIGILEIIHTDIWDPFLIAYVDGYDSFITFTNDYSCYGYIYLIKERLEDLDKFKIFNAEVKNQHDIKIKIVRSDRGGGGTMVVIPHMTKFLDLLWGSYRKMA
jgi:hypothetical protein